MTKRPRPPYFVLFCDVSNELGEYLDVNDGVEIPGVTSWRIGRRFAAPIETPIIFDAVAEGDSATGPAEMLNGTVLLLSERLVRALQEAGVDNLDVYSAEIRTTEGGHVYRTHKAVNIIGVIAAADLGACENVRIDGTPVFDVGFDSLSLHPDTSPEYLMFRLAENNSTILVHVRVRDHIIKSGIDTLKFLEPEDWVRA